MGKKKVNRHHVRPQSRGGGDTVLWDEKFHTTFHELFWNMTPREQHEFLDEINVPGTYWDSKRLARLRKRIMRGTMKGGDV